MTTATFLVDGKKLQHLLRPKHKYYADKWGSIASIACYEDEDEGKRLLYPKVRAVHRENPYRKMQIRRQTTGRTTKTIRNLVENNKLADFRVADLVFTYPREVSEYLATQGKRGRGMAWRMEERLWSQLGAVGLHSSGLARSVNLHVWKTENPLQPHFHFHEMIPNYELTVVDGLTDEDDGEVFQLLKRPWDTGRGGSGGIWTKEELHTVKSVWTLVIKRFSRQQ